MIEREHSRCYLPPPSVQPFHFLDQMPLLGILDHKRPMGIGVIYFLTRDCTSLKVRTIPHSKCWPVILFHFIFRRRGEEETSGGLVISVGCKKTHQ